MTIFVGVVGVTLGAASLAMANIPGLGAPSGAADAGASATEGDAAGESGEAEQGEESAGEAAVNDEGPLMSLMAVLDPEELGALGENRWADWLVLLAMIFVGLFVGKVVQTILLRTGERLERHGWSARGHLFTDAASPAKLLIFAVALSSGLTWLAMGEALEDVVRRAMLLLVWGSVFWFAFNLVGVLDIVLRRLSGKENAALDDQLVPIIRKALRIFLVVVATLFIAQNIFDQQITAWLAGLGIAGLAVSLAAQDSLRNLFGSITILLDKPFHVGDRIKYGEYDGVIEEIGFRSTKVRTLTGHVVTVPNSNIVNDPVENIAKRPTIRRFLNVTITYDTPVEKIQQGVQIIRDILEEEEIAGPIHPVVNGDVLPPRVYFSDFNSDSLNIFVMYWFTPPAWWDYLEHAQKVNLRIFEEFEAAGIDFAFPTQTLHLAGDPKRQLAVRMLGADVGGD